MVCEILIPLPTTKDGAFGPTSTLSPQWGVASATIPIPPLSFLTDALTPPHILSTIGSRHLTKRHYPRSHTGREPLSVEFGTDEEYRREWKNWRTIRNTNNEAASFICTFLVH